MWSPSKNLTAKRREKIGGIVFVASWLWMMLLFAYGLLRWPYAPIRPVGELFLDKKDHEFTEEVFLQFKAWETTLWMSFFGCAAAVLLTHLFLKVPFRFQPGRRRKRN